MSERIVKAARKLYVRMNMIHADPIYQSVWQLYHIHHGPYCGPKYEDEFKALGNALVKAKRKTKP